MFFYYRSCDSLRTVFNMCFNSDITEKFVQRNVENRCRAKRCKRNNKCLDFDYINHFTFSFTFDIGSQVTIDSPFLCPFIRQSGYWPMTWVVRQ